MNRTLQSFGALIQRDMVVFLPTWKDRFINGLIWGILSIVIFEYVVPRMGMGPMGTFMAAGVTASWGFFEVTENSTRFIADLEGERSISYYLTLPFAQWGVFARIGITNALQAMSISALFLPLSKIVLQDAFSFAHFSFFKFIVIFLLIHLFYGFFSLYLTAQIKSLSTINNVWMRIVFPLWWIGCYQFSWQALYSISPGLALMNLVNPLVYAMEGMRAAVMGQEGFLNFWWCVGALVVWTFIAGCIGTRKLRHRLDCL